VGFEKISLKGRALKLLAAREHSRAELERKLKPHEEEPGSLQTALDALQAKGFINEDRVLESVIHRRASKLGGARLKQELQAKGLDAAAVSQALADLAPSELARAREVWRKKYANPPQTSEERAKHARFLIARGFSGEVVRRVVNAAHDEA
jgi:regulatory protein